LIVTGIFLLISCKKPAQGYLSSNVFYQVSPFVAEQGVTSYSAALQLNGSTNPTTVILIGVRESQTGKDMLDSLIKLRSIPVFTGTVLKEDTTLASLLKNISTDLKPALNINTIGGRIELSSATKYLPSGTYDIDIEVKNTAGTKVIKNACQISLVAPLNPYVIVYKRLRIYTKENPAVVESASEGIVVDVTYTASAVTKVIYKFVDQNGVAFNPATGQLKRFSAALPTMKEWAPYYPEVKTATTIEYTLPNTGTKFPYVEEVYLPNGLTYRDPGGALSYMTLDENANVEGKRAQITSSWIFKTSGTYEITFHLNGLTKK